MPTARACTVSFTDAEGITHAVEITASSLYEAAVLGLAEFRRCGFVEATFGSGTKLTVKVRQPEMPTRLALLGSDRGSMAFGKSPREHAMKSKFCGLVL